MRTSFVVKKSKAFSIVTKFVNELDILSQGEPVFQHQVDPFAKKKEMAIAISFSLAHTLPQVLAEN